MDTNNLMKIAGMTEEEARKMVESIRWPNGVVCPKCGSNKGAYKMQSKPGTKKPMRPGLYKCKACAQKFTVTMGTIFEDSHIPLNKWLAAIYLMNASKKGMSAHQLHRMLDITYKSAWFMAHRIRYAMEQKPLTDLLKGTVEADEAYIGGKEKNKHANKRTENNQGRSTKTKTPVAVLVERDGNVKACKVEKTDSASLQENIRRHVERSARIITDEWQAYKGLEKEFTGHELVNHGHGEYVRGDVYTNTAESWNALLKRGIVGAFHHVSEEHLDRYVNGFAFRWDYRKESDVKRMVKAIEGAEGKRLIYKETVNQKAS
jgi:transposase-like protein